MNATLHIHADESRLISGTLTGTVPTIQVGINHDTGAGARKDPVTHPGLAQDGLVVFVHGNDDAEVVKVLDEFVEQIQNIRTDVLRRMVKFTPEPVG